MYSFASLSLSLSSFLSLFLATLYSHYFLLDNLFLPNALEMNGGWG